MIPKWIVYWHKNRKIDEVDETTTETDRQVERDTKKEKKHEQKHYKPAAIGLRNVGN